MIVPLLILCARGKEKKESDTTLRGNTSRTPTTNNAETIDTAPSQKQQIGVGSTVVSPPQPALPFQNGSTMKTSDEQIDDKPSGKEEMKGAKQEKDSASKKTGILSPSKKNEGNSPKPKSNKSSKRDKQNTPHDSKKLIVSGKDTEEKAAAWPVRPKWSESVPESQVADDLSDFALTKRSDSTVNDKKKEKKEENKEDKKDEKKEDVKKSFLEDVKKEKEENKEEGKDEKKEEKREEKKEEEEEMKKDEKEEKKEEKKE